MPKTARSMRGAARNAKPMTHATPRPIDDATSAARRLRSGRPAPRFCPATAAVAPIRPTEVQVISENSSVYPTA